MIPYLPIGPGVLVSTDPLKRRVFVDLAEDATGQTPSIVGRRFTARPVFYKNGVPVVDSTGLYVTVGSGLAEQTIQVGLVTELTGSDGKAEVGVLPSDVGSVNQTGYELRYDFLLDGKPLALGVFVPSGDMTDVNVWSL